MTVQEHINLLRAEIEKLKAVEPLMISNEGHIVIDDAIKQRKRKIADLEAQAAAEADPFQRAKAVLKTWRERHRLRILDEDLGKVLIYADFILTENRRLEAELAKRPVVYVARHRVDGSLVKARDSPILWLLDEITKAQKVDSDYLFEPYTGQQS